LTRGKSCWLDMGKGSPGCFEGGMAAGGIRARVSRKPRGYWGKKFRWVVNGSCARPQMGEWVAGRGRTEPADGGRSGTRVGPEGGPA
jgi:hypothetical protein